MLKFIDIAVNLTDSMFNGIYNCKKYHESDVSAVLNRCKIAGVEKLIVTGTSVNDAKNAIELCESSENLFCTVGCHPTNSTEFDNEFTTSDDYLEKLKSLAQSSKKVVAFGECGLDYYRLNLCPKEIQKKKQLELNELLKFPLFLHCRNAADDFIEIIQDFPGQTGVIHSFTDSVEDLERFLKMGFSIGLNGCSLKTEDNVKAVELIPIERMMIETDSPWCEVRKTHASYQLLDPELEKRFRSVKKEKWNESVMIKGRNEPANILLVFDIITKIKKIDPDILANQIYENTTKMFFS